MGRVEELTKFQHCDKGDPPKAKNDILFIKQKKDEYQSKQQ